MTTAHVPIQAYKGLDYIDGKWALRCGSTVYTSCGLWCDGRKARSEVMPLEEGRNKYFGVSLEVFDADGERERVEMITTGEGKSKRQYE